MAPSRPPLLWPMAAPTAAPASVLRPRSSAIAVDETANAASITAPKHFLFNMAFPLHLGRDRDDPFLPGHELTIAAPVGSATLNTHAYKCIRLCNIQLLRAAA